jgi:hypothetical protein
MLYELTIKMLVETPYDQSRVLSQAESLCEFGTVMESFADGLLLDRSPRLLNIEVVQE